MVLDQLAIARSTYDDARGQGRASRQAERLRRNCHEAAPDQTDPPDPLPLFYTMGLGDPIALWNGISAEGTDSRESRAHYRARAGERRSVRETC
jgi:hypothetical protein